MVTDSVKSKVNGVSVEYLRLYRLNQRWDIGLTISGIALAILAGTSGVLGDKGDTQKIITGFLTTLSAAVQAGQSKFPVQARAKGYHTLRRKSVLIELETELTDTTDDSVLLQLKKLSQDEADIP